MSLPSVAKDKTSNKISLVTRPSVTSVQPPAQVIGTTASHSQPTLIYVQSIQPQSTHQKQYHQHQHQQQHQQQPALIGTNQLNKPKSLNQPISIISSKTIRPPSNKSTINTVVTLPSTSELTNRVHTVPLTVGNRHQQQTSITVPNRVQTIHFKSHVTNASSVQPKSTPSIITQQVNVVRPELSDKTSVTRITKIKQIPTTSTQQSSLNKNHNLTPVEKIFTTTTAPITSGSNHKTSASNATKVDPTKYRYRTILENLLQLKNNFIRRTITQAIQQKLCNQSNEDLLNVIFKSFELTLLSVNVEQIALNETYLNATLAFLAKVIETGRFMELIENRKETKDITKFVSLEMSTILNKVSLQSVYNNARDIFQQKQRGSYAQILELLNKVIGLVKLSTDTKMTASEIEFWLKDVMPTIIDTDEDIQSNGIEAMNKVVPLLLASKHQSHPYWQQTRTIILNDYTQKIGACFRQGNPKWYMVWCLCVRLLDVDIPRSASTLNAFLSIVEPALRSNVPIRRAEGYLCWRVLLEVLVRHNRLNSEKRLKLMCTPLKSLQAKTLEIARNKFQAWWYVLCNVQENVDNYISMVFEPFLQFCFGQLFPTPNLQLIPSEGATQVKSFPTVSLMAVCSFLRMLDESDKQLDELFVKFSLNQPKHFILTETIFNRNSTAAIVINACGEATIMLNNLRNDANNNIDCTTLAVCLWTRLFKHVNQAKNTEHINLILDNVSQLLMIENNSFNTDSRMIPLVCASILDHISSSFVFDPSEDGEISADVSESVAKFMNICLRYPNTQSRFETSLSRLLSVPEVNVEQFFQNLSNFLSIIDEQVFKSNEQSSEMTLLDAPMMCCQFINCILTYIQSNADAFKTIQLNTTNLRIPPLFFNIIYWPLSFSLSKDDFDVYTKTLLKTIDILLTMISKSDFCKESAIIVKNIIAKPNHCIYINDAIAMLFDYMVYDFDDVKEAPIDMLNLCVLVVKKDSKIVFQDLNSIAEALIKYRRAISHKQFEIIAPKMRDVVKLIENEKSNMRTESSLIKDLKELVGEESNVDKSPGQTNKSLRSSKNNRTGKDEFIVVNKVWKLEPGKLTEHQREKMKTRRCDIPALYNDLSQSQDSVSIQEWTPKSLPPPPTPPNNSKHENNVEKVTANDTTIETTTINESPISQRAKKSKNSPKRSNASQNQNQTQSQIQNENESIEKETSDDVNNSKRRITRELNRIQMDVKVEEVPYNSLPEINRLTRSTVKKIEEKPDEKRKTRSQETIKMVDPKEVNKKKTTRASLANSPLPKKKAKLNEKSVSAESETSGEPTPKRRLTRQSKTEESENNDETMEEKKVDIKVENKKTEFVDTLELKVEKLPLNLTSKSIEKLEIQEKSEEILVETCTTSESQDQTENRSEIVAEVETKVEIVEKQDENEEKDVCAKMDVDETANEAAIEKPIPFDENKENVEKMLEPVCDQSTATQAMDVDTDKPENATTEADAVQNEQVLVETATVPNVVESMAESKLEEDQHENNSDNENEISSRSYMSALVFDGISPSRSLNGSTIVSSPEIDAPRSIEFLNDTLNISPISSDTKKDDHVSSDQAKKKVAIDDDLEGIEKMEESMTEEKPDLDVKTEKSMAHNDVTNEKEPVIGKDSENESNKNATTVTAAVPIETSAPVPESPIVSSTKQLKQSLTMQSSTPLQSHHSPVSSKFKTQLVGRGAQLLKMINSNKSPKPASPTPASMIENAFKTTSPTINQLETAPICENIMNTPEPKSSKDRHADKHEQNENGNFLTFSGALPSPYESPGISILKRKSFNISMDDSMHSPAPKRKRVSFGFPLSQTKEYIVDEDFTPYYMLPSNDSPCRRANRLKKLKLKRNKYHTESAKNVANENKIAVSSKDTTNSTTESIVPTKDDEVSVKQIQEYLGMDIDTDRAKPEKQLTDENASEASATNATSNDLHSDDSSTESNDDDPEIEAAPPTQTPTGAPAATATETLTTITTITAKTTASTVKSIAEFSDDEIFAHLLSKYSPTDILKKLEPSIDAKVLTKRLSTIMSNDTQIKSTVLEELAEQHSESFLEHAITENLCSVICERLSMKSSNGINDYFADKINSDDQFASDFLDRISVSVLRQKLMDIVTTSKREQHILLEDFLVALKDYIRGAHRLSPKTVDTDLLPEHVHLWVSKLFDQFKLTAEQYLQLTSIYIQRNPPAALDHFD